MKPQSELGYTNSDDGIWITCVIPSDDETVAGDRHWQYNLGFWPTVMDAMEVWQRHLDAAHLEVMSEIHLDGS